jgi:hypothetical protein
VKVSDDGLRYRKEVRNKWMGQKVRDNQTNERILTLLILDIKSFK